VFAPQVARILGDDRWLTVEEVAGAFARGAAGGKGAGE
jgi:hypothetical protein